MSWEATSWAWRLEGLSPTQKLVLMGLANYANSDNICFPGQSRIGEHAGVSDRTVRTIVKQLEEMGVISRKRRHGDGGYRTSDMYVLHVETDLPANTSASSYRKSGAGLPEIEGDLTGSPLPGNSKRTVSNHQIGELVDADVIEEGSTSAKPFPAEFLITPKMKAWADKNVPHLDLVSETREFVAYWKHGEGKGKKRKNWVMTWQNRMRQKYQWLPASERSAPRKVKKF